MAFQAGALHALMTKSSISALDVVQLQDALTFEGPVTEAEALALFAIELSDAAKHPSWKGVFIDALCDFTVYQTEPYGYLTALKADWVLRMAAPRGRVLTPNIFALLEALMTVARWVPERLIAAMLDEVYCAVGAGNGPLRYRANAVAGQITQLDCDVVRHILYCAGSGGNLPVGRAEAEGLLAINAAVTASGVPAEWTELFCKAIGDAALNVSGFAGPVREVFLARSMLDGGTPVAGAISKGFAGYRRQAPEDRAITSLERQRISIITGDEFRPVTADWLAQALERHHQPPSESLSCLQDALKQQGIALGAPAAASDATPEHSRAA